MANGGRGVDVVYAPVGGPVHGGDFVKLEAQAHARAVGTALQTMGSRQDQGEIILTTGLS